MLIQTQRGWLRSTAVTETKVESWSDGWVVAYHAPQGWVWGIERHESKDVALKAARLALEVEMTAGRIHHEVSAVGTDHVRVGPEVGDRFVGGDDPVVAALPDGTVVVNEYGDALLRCDGRWVDGWFGTFSALDEQGTFAVLHIPKEVV